MRKIVLIMILMMIVLVGGAHSTDEDEYHFVIWCQDGSTKYWYVAVNVRYDERMSSWVLTEAARLDGDRIIRLLSVVVPGERIVSVERVIAVHAEELV
jgi:hypothetical protein